MIYFGLTMGVGGLAGGPHLNLALSGSLNIPALPRTFKFQQLPVLLFEQL